MIYDFKETEIVSVKFFLNLFKVAIETRESSEWVVVRLNSGNLLKRPRKNEKVDFWGSVLRDIGSSLVSLKMIFKALPFELFRWKFRILGWKILKIPEFN